MGERRARFEAREAFFAAAADATPYVAVEVGEPMDPRKAQFNALTVQEWQRGVKQFWPTKEKFEEYIKNRKAKKDAELEGDTGKGGEKKGG